VGLHDQADLADLGVERAAVEFVGEVAFDHGVGGLDLGPLRVAVPPSQPPGPQQPLHHANAHFSSLTSLG
jgi:hypothetical protein